MIRTRLTNYGFVQILIVILFLVGIASLGVYYLQTQGKLNLSPGQTIGSSGIYGTATLWPTCLGAERVGQICTNTYVGTIAIGKQIQNQTKLGNFEEIVRFQTNSDGSFRVSLPPGDYVAKRLDNSVIFNLAKTPIHVEDNKFLEVNIQFDTGIR